MTAHQTIAAALGLSLDELADNSYTATPAELEQIRPITPLSTFDYDKLRQPHQVRP